MSGRLKFLLCYFLAWIIFFELARLVFVLYNLSQASELSFASNALAFFYGARMDVSVAAYIMLPVSIFVLCSVFLSFFQRPLLYRMYTYTVLFLVLILVVCDLEVYRNWGFRIDTTPLKYLDAPREAWASVSHLPVFRILLALLIIYLGFCYLFNLLIRRTIRFLPSQKKRLIATIAVIVFTCLLIVPIRGGLQQIPINQSSVYFSKHNFANITAINASWNFLYSLSKNRDTRNPYLYLDSGRTRRIIDSLYQPGSGSTQVLHSPDPNVLVIIWESFTEKAIHANIGGKEITPRFNELIKEGIYFSQVYASGDRTDKGLSAVLSAYPALNNFSIIHQPKKSASLAGLPGLFKAKGYRTAFYYGGETEFANLKSYLLQGKFDRMTDKNDFDKKDRNSKWGAHDGVVAKRILEDLNKERGPYFTTWLTLSSHEPFEIPEAPVFAGQTNTTLFLNSLHYTDEVIYQLIGQMKKRPDWNNTLVIIVADHGHPLIEPSTTIDNRRIPMLWLGGALKEHGKIDRIASQLDLAESLARQVNAGKAYFPFGRDLFDSTLKQWAYFSFNNGFGLVQPGKAFVFDNIGKQLNFKQGPVTDHDLEVGKALQQFYYEDYLRR